MKSRQRVKHSKRLSKNLELWSQKGLPRFSCLSFTRPYTSKGHLIRFSGSDALIHWSELSGSDRGASPDSRACDRRIEVRLVRCIPSEIQPKLEWPVCKAIVTKTVADRMRTAIVSDIHGNRRAFQAVLADLRQVAPDFVLHGGDLAAGGAHPADIIDQVRSLGWPGVRGNADEMLWSPERLAEFAAAQPKLAPTFAMVQEMIPPTRASIGEERLRWLEGLPCLYSQESFSLVHASPDDLWRAPLPNASDVELHSTYASLRAQIVVYGHIHCPYIRRVQGMTIANTGSVSQSYDGDRRASYLLIDGESITNRRIEYDVESEAKELLCSGLPHADWLSRILLAGRYCSPD